MASISFISASKLVQLLNAGNTGNDMYVRVLCTNRLALGADPLQPTHLIDLSKEKVGPCNPGELAKIPDQPASAFPATTQMPTRNASSSKITRRSGDYWFEIKERRIDCTSLKELLSEGLQTLEEERPGTLEKLSYIKPRSRRIVARDPKQLFDREHLVEQYSERLMDGWWYGTNNSALETNSWLKRGCSCSGLKWGPEFKTGL